MSYKVSRPSVFGWGRTKVEIEPDGIVIKTPDGKVNIARSTVDWIVDQIRLHDRYESGNGCAETASQIGERLVR